MNIILEQGDEIEIPVGYKAIIKDGFITIKKQIQNFKSGDILCHREGGHILIFKCYNKNGTFKAYYDDEEMWGADFDCANYRLATKHEQNVLFKVMADRGRVWNSEKKICEYTRWRALNGERYYTIWGGFKIDVFIERGTFQDDIRYYDGIYFRTLWEAEKAVKIMRENMREFHKEK